MPHYQLPELAPFVLSLNLKSIESESEYIPLQPKTDNFNDFYNQFRPLILNEVTSALQTALNKATEKSRIRVSLKDKDKIQYYQKDDITMMSLTNDDRIVCGSAIGSYHFIVSVIYTKKTSHIGILNIYQEEYQIAMNGNITEILDDDSHFEILPLASLTNLDRMYSVCITKPQSNLVRNIIQASVMSWPTTSSAQTSEAISHLNQQQRLAVAGFCSAPEGVFLLQGPPGTGKTTTIVSMLQRLVTDKRTLVCAPSNKAIQVLADKAQTALPSEPILLIGVESKITSAKLQEISFDNWINRYPNKLKAKLEELKIDALLEINPVSLEKNINFSKLMQFINRADNITYEIKELVRICFRYTVIETTYRVNLIQMAGSFLEEYFRILKMTHDSQKQAAFPAFGEKPSPSQAPNQVSNTATTITQLNTLYINIYTFFQHQIFPQIPQEQNSLLIRSKILFATLSITGRTSLQRQYSRMNIGFHNLIIDEAGQAVEAETLIPFALARDATKVLLVGDTRQLPATTIAPSSKTTLFERSMMWRLLETNSQPYLSLDRQYRMREHIRHFPSSRYYYGKLNDDESILNRVCHLPAHFIPKHGLKLWIDTKGQEERNELSFINRAEAIAVLEMVKTIREYDTKSQIGIISFYGAQVGLIRKLFEHEKSKNNKLNHNDITISTVDGFQGDEKDIIIISFVRANQNHQIGFLNDFRRLNVSITRAKDALFLFGDVNTFKKAGESEVSELLYFLIQMKAIKKIDDVLNNLRHKHPQPSAPLPHILPVVAPIRNLTAPKTTPYKGKSLASVAAINPKQLYSDKELIEQAARFNGKMEYEKAIENYLLVLDHQPKRADIYQLLAQCYNDLGDTEQAQLMRDVGNGLQNEPNASSSSSATPSQESTVIAAKFLVPTKNRRNIKLALKEGRQLSDQGKYLQAEQFYLQLLDDETTNNAVHAEVFIGLGWVFHKQFKHKQGERYFELSLQLVKCPLAYQGLIQCKRGLNDFETALDLACEALDYFPWSKTILDAKIFLEGRVQQQTPVPAAKATTLTAAPVPAAKATTLMAAPVPATKATTLTAAWAAPASASSSSTARPILHNFSTNKITNALTADDFQSEFKRACKLSKEWQGEAAEIIFKKLMTQQPENPKLLEEYGWCLGVLRRNKEAIPVLEKCLTKINSYSSYLALTRCYQFTGEIGKALLLANQCLKHFPADKKMLGLTSELTNVNNRNKKTSK